MTVWLLTNSFPYEGYVVYGAFSSEATATEAMEAYLDGEYSSGTWEISPLEVDVLVGDFVPGFKR